MPDPITPEQVTAIKARTDLATAGPWFIGPEYVKELHPWEVVISGELPFIELRPDEQGRADAAFIAAARTDVPDLLARLRAVESERDSYREALEADDKGALISALWETVASADGVRDGLAEKVQRVEALMAGWEIATADPARYRQGGYPQGGIEHAAALAAKWLPELRHALDGGESP